MRTVSFPRIRFNIPNRLVYEAHNYIELLGLLECFWAYRHYFVGPLDQKTNTRFCCSCHLHVFSRCEQRVTLCERFCKDVASLWGKPRNGLEETGLTQRQLSRDPPPTWAWLGFRFQYAPKRKSLRLKRATCRVCCLGTWTDQPQQRSITSLLLGCLIGTPS